MAEESACKVSEDASGNGSRSGDVKRFLPI
jgi:hypothetical protein